MPMIAVHRRADLVAHVGEELALGPVGGARRLARGLQLEVLLLEEARLGVPVDEVARQLLAEDEQQPDVQRHAGREAERQRVGWTVRQTTRIGPSRVAR